MELKSVPASWNIAYRKSFIKFDLGRISTTARNMESQSNVFTFNKTAPCTACPTSIFQGCDPPFSLRIERTDRTWQWASSPFQISLQRKTPFILSISISNRTCQSHSSAGTRNIVSVLIAFLLFSLGKLVHMGPRFSQSLSLSFTFSTMFWCLTRMLRKKNYISTSSIGT